MDDKTTANGRGAESNMVDPVRGTASNGASEAKDQGAISKPDSQPDSAGVPIRNPQAEPEVQILEEHVTHAAQKPASPQKPAPAPVLPPTPPVANNAPASAPVPTAAAASVPPPPAPARDPAPLPQGNTALGTDIEKILSSVKLPERRDAALPGERKIAAETRKFDTSIAGSALGETSATPFSETPSVPKPQANTSAETAQSPAHAAGRGAVGRNPSDVSAVHTLKDDLQGGVHDQKISLVKAVSLEEDRRAKKGAAASATPGAQQRSNRTFAILLASLTLLLLGAGARLGVAFP